MNDNPILRPVGIWDGQEARWESIGCPMVRGLNPLAVSRFTDNPNSAARRKNSMDK